MGYISHPKVMSSWMIGFLPHHAKWGELLSHTMSSLHICTPAYVYDEQHHFFMLITVNKSWYDHFITASVVYLILSVDTWLITTISFHGYVEVINKKVGNICWVLYDFDILFWCFWWGNIFVFNRIKHECSW